MSTIFSNPGNIVIPLSTILDQLKGKLSSSEIDALLSAILSQKKTEVRPGDLITVELMNQILNDLANLNQRVAQLEGGVSTGYRNIHLMDHEFHPRLHAVKQNKRGTMSPVKRCMGVRDPNTCRARPGRNFLFQSGDYYG